MFRRIITIASLLTTVLLLPSAAAEQAANLPLYTVEKQTIPDELYVDGVIEAVNQTTVSAQTSGTIIRLLFDVNDYVEKDEVIAEFTNKEQKAGVDKAKASLAAALARQSEARSEYERISSVFDKGAVSKSQMDKTRAELKAADAAVDSARATLAQAQEQLEYTLIRAPYSGIVTRRHVEPGEAAKPGTPIMTGLSLDDLRVHTQVPQRHIEAVTRFDRARVIVKSEAGIRSIDSNLVTLFPFANMASHTMTVRIDLPTNTRGLFPGMFVKAAFLVGEKYRLVIPRSAVVRRSEVTAVYVIQDEGYISMRQIRVGRATYNDKVEVLSGLNEGEKVITDPQAALQRYLKQG